MKAKVAIIGKGNVGGALQRGLKRAGYDVRAVGKGGDLPETARWGDAVILAVPYGQIDSTLSRLGDGLDGKTVVDATNVLTPDLQLAVGFTTSGAEELQKKAPRAKVVKAFNTVFARSMSDGKAKGQVLTIFAAGDDSGAKQQVLALCRDIGFDAVDAGPLRNSRYLEAMGGLNVQLGYVLKMGTEIGLKLVH